MENSKISNNITHSNSTMNNIKKNPKSILVIEDKNAEDSAENIFFWNSNQDQWNDGIFTWTPYDESLQEELFNSYKSYNKNNENHIFYLKDTDYYVDFKKNLQINQKDINKKCHIKLDKKIYDQQFKFFWKANKDPFKNDELAQWSPYDEQDQYILANAYNIFLLNPNKNIVTLTDSDWKVDYKNKMQFNAHDKFRQRPILREIPKYVSNIIRFNRFHNENKSTNDPEPIFIDQHSIKANLLKKDFKEENKQIKLLYEKNLPYQGKLTMTFENNNTFETIINNELINLTDIKQEITFSGLIKLIKNEIKELFNTEAYESYYNYLNSIKNMNSFFENIIKIYTLEGALYRLLNEYLRLNENKINRMKYYFICLLMSFQYCSQYNKENQIFGYISDISIYRCSKSTEKEKSLYINEVSKSGKCIRIFNEFISTSRDKNACINLIDKTNKKVLEFLWEIKVPKYILKNESENFAFVENISQYTSEKEVLLKSGCLIEICEICPLYEEINGKNIGYENKFVKKCVLRSFSFNSFLKILNFERGLEIFDLSNNGLGGNTTSIKILKQFLENNKNLRILKLDKNNFCNKSEVFKILYNIGKNCEKLEELSLEGNNIGNDINIIHQINNLLNVCKNLKILNLKSNYFTKTEKDQIYQFTKDSLNILF